MLNRDALIEISRKLENLATPATREQIASEIEFLEDNYPNMKKEISIESQKRKFIEWFEELEKFPIWAIKQGCKNYRLDENNAFAPSTIGQLLPYIDKTMFKWRNIAMKASHAIRKIDTGYIEKVIKNKITQAEVIELNEIFKNKFNKALDK